MTGLKMIEDLCAIWMDDSMREKMDDTEANWELYCRERQFDHSFMGSGWIVTIWKKKDNRR